MPLNLMLEDDGSAWFADADGTRISDQLARLTKRQHGDAIREKLAASAERINAAHQELAQFHYCTPRPSDRPARTVRTFTVPEPQPDLPKQLDVWSRLLRKREEVEADNAENRRLFEEAHAKWQRIKKMFEARELHACEEFDRRVTKDVTFMHQVFEDTLQAIAWPRETLVSFQIADDGRAVDIDVDLPEVEDMPRTTAKLPDRGYRLTIKELSARTIADHYAQHVHSVGFRIIGESFATLPSVNRVTLSAFTQRDDPASGNVLDTYVYSVQVPRADWMTTNFANLPAVDVIESLGRFAIRRQIARGGKLERIEPFE